MIFSFGQSKRECIEIDVLGYENQPVGEYYDDNWLTVEICVHAGGFHGKTCAALITSELVKSASELSLLFETLSGSAKFETVEDQLSLQLVGDGKGHIELRGEVADRAGDGNRLSFTLQFDQSQLGISIRQLEKVTLQFPVRVAL